MAYNFPRAATRAFNLMFHVGFFLLIGFIGFTLLHAFRLGCNHKTFSGLCRYRVPCIVKPQALQGAYNIYGRFNYRGVKSVLLTANGHVCVINQNQLIKQNAVVI